MKNLKESNFSRNEISNHCLVDFVEVLQEICTGGYKTPSCS